MPGRSNAKRTSAGLLIYRTSPSGLERTSPGGLARTSLGGIEVLLVHPGGPFWARKDLGAWSIPKGEAEDGEDLLAVAHRELAEETGVTAPGDALPLGHVRQKSGKVVHAWAVRGDADPSAIRSNTFTLEWPPRSGRMQTFPEIDRAAWFDLAEARRRINPAQAAFLDALARLLSRA